jgi:dihydroflavonol-4-reductase
LPRSVFITGATGFIGSHTAELFLREGWNVHALVRRPDKPGLLPAGVTVVAGDLQNGGACRAGMAGCDAVVHVAGLVKARTLAQYRQANAFGAEQVARQAAEVCPRAMFVLVSSQSAAGPALKGRPVTESDPPRPVSWYGQSKLEGEEAVARTCPGPWCVVRPSVVYGRGDPGVLELFTVIQSGWAPIIAGGRMPVQLIAVSDVARILFAAANRPDLSGRRGFAAGDTVTTGQWIRFIAGLRNPPARCFPVPALAMRAAGLVESARQGLTGKVRPFNRDKAREALQPAWRCDPTPLLNDLGIRDLVSWQQGLRDVCRCYVDSGGLRRSIWTV